MVSARHVAAARLERARQRCADLDEVRDLVMTSHRDRGRRHRRNHPTSPIRHRLRLQALPIQEGALAQAAVHVLGDRTPPLHLAWVLGCLRAPVTGIAFIDSTAMLVDRVVTVACQGPQRKDVAI